MNAPFAVAAVAPAGTAGDLVVVVVVGLVAAAVGFAAGRRSARPTDEPSRRVADAGPLQVEHHNTLDDVTLVATRAHFEEVLESEWRRSYREGCPLSIVMVRIEAFEELKRSVPVERQNEVLKQVAGRLSSELRRARDRVGRYSDDEFAVLVGVAPDAARIIADRFQSSIASLGIPHPSSPAGRVSVITGVAGAYPRDGFLGGALVAAAREALIAPRAVVANVGAITGGGAPMATGP